VTAQGGDFRTARCWCNRPVARDVVDAVECAEHDNPPPTARSGIPRPGMAAALALALACIAIPLGVLVAHLRADYAVIPTPDGPAVIHVQEDAP